MRNGVSWTRRAAAVLSLAVTALVVTGSGAGAAGIDSYDAQASGTTLSLSVQLPLGGVLNGVLANAGFKGGAITERIAFSNATANVAKGSAPAGQALGQVFFGTLDATLLQVSRLVGYTGDKLPQSEARVGGTASSAPKPLAAVDLGPLHIGVGETTSTANVVSGLVQTHSMSRLLGIKVDLASVLSDGAIANLLKPVTDLLDGTSSQPGLIDSLNGLLNGVEKTLKDSGLNVDLTVPKVKELINKPLLSVGIIESISDTSFDGASRLAKGVTHLANIDALGGFIHVDALNIESFASIDGTANGAKASAIQRIVGLRVGGNVVNLNTGSLQVLGKTISLGADITKLLNLTVDALGLKVAVAQAPQIIRSAAHARAAASSLHVELAPKVGGTALFSIALDGPASVADVRGGGVLGVKEIRIPTTGLNDSMLFLAGPMLIGFAVLVRRFALSK